MSEKNHTFKVVGHSVEKLDGFPLAVGAPLFTEDIHLPRMLIGKILGSPHAHARIKDIRTSKAESLPGVHAVLTYKNVPRVAHTTAYWIRMEEMRQSARIISQCLDQMPAGPIMAEEPQYIPPPKELVMRDMESLIHHFIIFTQGFKPPKAETYCGTEAPKGELGFFIISDGSPRPYRLKIRPPSFIHMGAFDHMARGYLISDIITIFGTYDIVMGECDR